MHVSSKDTCQLLLHMNNVEQGIASGGRKGHHHVHITVFGIEVFAQDGPEKLECLDAPLATEILDLILRNWNARGGKCLTMAGIISQPRRKIDLTSVHGLHLDLTRIAWSPTLSERYLTRVVDGRRSAFCIVSDEYSGYNSV